VTAEVSFGSTDNPFFFGEADRRPSPSLEEEALWEEVVGNGDTTLDLVAWVGLRRAEFAPESFEMISVAPWGEEPASEENGLVLFRTWQHAISYSGCALRDGAVLKIQTEALFCRASIARMAL